jgi:hypothetical protein
MGRAAVGIVCINLRRTCRQTQAPGTTGRIMPGPSHEGPALFLVRQAGRPIKKGGVEKMAFSIFLPYLVFFKGFSSGKRVRHERA